MKRRKVLFWVLVGGFVLISLVVLISLFIIRNNQKDSNNTQPTNFNSISDSSIGLTFNMSKNLQPIPKAEVAAMNPGFGYGFKPLSDPNAICIVSQTTLKSSGTVTAKSLRDGLFKEIKSIHPDAVLDNAETASNWAIFGEGRGVLLQVSYTDGSAKIKRVEIIALGKAKPVQVTAYCQSLTTDSSKYYDDFTIFFSSLKIQ